MLPCFVELNDALVLGNKARLGQKQLSDSVDLFCIVKPAYTRQCFLGLPLIHAPCIPEDRSCLPLIHCSFSSSKHAAFSLGRGAFLSVGKGTSSGTFSNPSETSHKGSHHQLVLHKRLHPTSFERCPQGTKSDPLNHNCAKQVCNKLTTPLSWALWRLISF